MPTKKYISRTKTQSKMPNKKTKTKTKTKSKSKSKSKLKSKSKSKSKSKLKSKAKSKSKSKSKSKLHSTKHQSLLDIIKQMSVSRNNISKSQNNLPAHLMKMNKKNKKTNKITNKTTNINTNIRPIVFNKSFSKSATSSYSSVMKNGKTKIHSEGKEIINNSNKPFIEIHEMDNGSIKHYMVPKNTIPYKPIGYKSL
jgi:hypothetical protein